MQSAPHPKTIREWLANRFHRMEDSASSILGSLGTRAEDRDHSVDPLEGLLDDLFAGTSSAAALAPRSPSSPRRSVASSSAPHQTTSRNAVRGTLFRGVGTPLDEDMMVTSSDGTPTSPSSPILIRGHVRGPAASQPNVLRSAVPTGGLVGTPRPRGAVSKAPTSRGSAAIVKAETEEEQRVRLARALCALHALRPSELSLLLSDWQRDWLLSRQSLCPPMAVAAMHSVRVERRPQRRRGAERIGENRKSSPPVAAQGPPSAVVAAHHDSTRGGSVELSDAVAATHGHLANWQRTFLRE